MRVLWVLGTHESELGPTSDRSMVARSPIASDRLRVAVPAAELSRLGVQSEFCVLRPGVPQPEPGGYDAVVFGKFGSPPADETGRVDWWWTFAQRALGAGCRVVVDVSDNPFAGANPRAALYRRLLPACSAASAPSAWLARAIAAHCAREPCVIADPFEGARAEARFAPSEPLRLLWFGHPLNLRYLQSRVPSLAELARERALALEVVTGEVQGIEAGLGSLTRQLAPRFSARYTPWSLEAMPQAFARCDLVIIPSDSGDPKKAGASPTRLIEALVAGRLPVASPLEAYRPYAQYAVLDEDIAAGLRHAWSAPAEAAERVRAGQAAVIERHAPRVVAQQWLELLAPEAYSGGGRTI
jgi:hypothetical protein